MNQEKPKVDVDRRILVAAQERGGAAVLGAFVRLSGPGWLQSAITLGGGSLAGALFLGVLAGTNLLWLQLMAITMGVIMLSAISYVTLSTGERPFRSINQHINPVLGWGWLIATCMANMIWCMPQFSLCYAALQRNLVGEKTLDDSLSMQFGVSSVLLVAAGLVVLMNSRRGLAARAFDWVLKALVAMIVLCFFGVVIYLSVLGDLDWAQIITGFVPDIRQWSQPTGDVAGLIASLPAAAQEFWSERVVREQRAVMIGAAATAVGINMTFLLPYSMLNRGWDKPFRGLARFDLATGMAIPYILVTSCVVIASAAGFHARIDDAMRSSDPTVMQQSEFFEGAKDILLGRLKNELGDSAYNDLTDEQRLAQIARLSEADKRIAVSLVRRNAFQLSQALAPLLGEQNANLVFGLGIFGMGFSTIIILMLINGYAFCEMLGMPQGGAPHAVGCLVAGVSGVLWPVVWAGEGDAKLWLAILASSFGMMLLPIAYCTFMMMMNSRSILGDNKPRGLHMAVWNVLMGISVLGAIAAAGTAIYDKATDRAAPLAGLVVIAILVVYLLLVGIGFFLRPEPTTASPKPEP